MKKSILTIMTLAMLAFVACTKEGENNQNNNQGNNDIPTINDNQMYFRGTTFEMNADALIPTENNYHNMCYIGAKSTDSLYKMICDISIGLFGRTIDLTHPCSDTAYGRYFLDLRDTSGIHGITLQGTSDGPISTLDTVDYLDPNTGEGSCFVSGTYVTTHDNSGIRVDLKGVLKDNTPFAMKLFVPENEIKHEWK